MQPPSEARQTQSAAAMIEIEILNRQIHGARGRANAWVPEFASILGQGWNDGVTTIARHHPAG
jgi:hypothetical protein